MTLLQAGLRAIHASLASTGNRFALVGGLAVSVRTEPRFTRDIDLAVAVESDGEAEAIVQALQAEGWTLEALVEQDAGELATLVVQRGFGRGRELPARLLTLRREFAGSGRQTDRP